MLQTIARKPELENDINLGARLAQMQGRPIGPEDVARVLRLAGVAYVLVGAHAANGYTGRPRATVDVDVVVRHPKRAAAAIAAAFPHLTMQDTPVVIRFKDQTHEAIDLMKASASKLWPELIKRSTEIQMGSERVRVPLVEGVLAAKFASMSSAGRKRVDKQQDGVDFLRVVDANEKIDLGVLHQLGELIFTGGGAEVVALIAQARRGEQLRF